MIERDYYPLSIAAAKVGCCEDELIYLGRTDKLKFYIDPANWARRKLGSLTSLIINDPILIDDPIHLSKLARGLESTLFFSEQYPDCTLEDLDAIESDALESSHEEFSDPQLGVPVTRDRLVIMADDLRQLQADLASYRPAASLPEDSANEPATNAPIDGNAKPLTVKRTGCYNDCIVSVINDFIENNRYSPTTVEEVINRMRYQPPMGTIIEFRGKNVSINGAAPKPIGNLERAIKRLFAQQKKSV